MCKYLLEELKIDVDTKDEDGDTPLIHAAHLGHTDIAKLLLEYGANSSIASDLGATALHHSAGLGNIELLRYLISKCVDVNSQSDAGSPLIWAAGHDQLDAVKVLLEHQANPIVESDDDITPLYYSIVVICGSWFTGMLGVIDSGRCQSKYECWWSDPFTHRC